MHAHLELPALYEVPVRSLAGLGENVTGDDSLPAYRHIRRLPPHGLLPHRSCLRLVLISQELSIWYTGLKGITGTKHRGLAPHNITPMLGVHEREAGLARVFENG